MQGDKYFKVGDRVKIVTLMGYPTGTIFTILDSGIVVVKLDKPENNYSEVYVYETQIAPIYDSEDKSEDKEKSFFEEAMTGKQIYLGSQKVYPLYDPLNEEWVISGGGTTHSYYFDKQGKYKLGPTPIEKGYNLSFEPIVEKQKVEVKKKIYIFSDNKTGEFFIHRSEDMIPKLKNFTVTPIEFSIFVEK